MSGYPGSLAYDGAPRPISPREANKIARQEYAWRGRMMLHRGSDGGMHFYGDAYSEGAARGRAEEKMRALVRRIMTGACTHTIFYDSARDRFYCG